MAYGSNHRRRGHPLRDVSARPGRNGNRQLRASGGPADPDVVYSENKLELIHYEARTDDRRDVPVVFVYAFINRPYILDFEPDRSVVGQFLDHGFDVYLLDWGEPSRLDTQLGLDDFVSRYLANCVDAVTERTDTEALHLFGYCTGATLSVIFAALYPDRVRTLGLLAPLLNFDAEGGIFRLWDRNGTIDPDAVLGVSGNAPGEWLGFAFALVDPVEYYVTRYLRAAEHIGDVAYLTRFLRRLQWGSDSVDVAGELYRQFLVELYRENRLIDGSLTVGGQSVDLANLSMPVLNIVGTEDRFIPAAASLPFLDVVPSTETDVIEFPTDHVGLSVGNPAHEELWPRVCEWLANHSADAVAGTDPSQ